MVSSNYSILNTLPVGAKAFMMLALLPLQGVSFPLHFTTGRCPRLVAFAPSGRYLAIANNHYSNMAFSVHFTSILESCKKSTA